MTRAARAKAPGRRRKRPALDEAAVDADRLRLCREGKHPPSRKIGRGCGLCGKLDAWRA